MSGGRGRRIIGSYVTDDDESLYEEIPAATRRSRSKLGVQFSDDRMRSPARRQKVYHTHSYGAPAEPETVIFENNLTVPTAYRPRASSTGAAPQPNFLYVQQPPREPSRERIKHYHQHKYDHESSDDETYRSSSRRRGHRRKSSPRSDYIDAETAKRLARLELLEEQQKQKSYDPSTAEKLSRLKALEDKRARDEEEAAIIARIDERKRKEKQREETLLLEYQERRRQEEDAEREAFAKAEAKRLKKEAEFRTERDRLLLLEREKAAKEKTERQRIIADAKAKAEEEEKEAAAERKRIILEDELKKKKAKEDHEELRRRILAEEEERIAKDKAKKKKEEEEFQQKVKERFMKAGYSPDYIEDILEEKKKALVRKTSTRNSESRLAIDMSRPTYIRVKLEHLYPQTLDHYELPWEYDPTDDRYVLIKEYISHELQQELFEHTRKLKIRREKLLLTDGYVKDTVTTLKPTDVFKDKSDDMFVVRRKSVSKSPRRNWMFT